MIITITVTSADEPRVFLSIAQQFGYARNIFGIDGKSTPNPEAPSDFVKRTIVAQLSSALLASETNKATASASAQTAIDVRALATITGQ
jgi:hypothetical protein